MWQCGLPDIFDDDADRQTKAPETFMTAEIKGGPDDLWQRLAIDTDGMALFADYNAGREYLQILFAERLQNVKHLFEVHQFDNYAGRYTDIANSGAVETIISYTHEGATKTVVMDFVSAPESLNEIISVLTGIIESIRSQTPVLQIEMKKIVTNAKGSYELRLTASNKSDKQVTLSFSSSKTFDFDISRPAQLRNNNRVILWSWSENRFYPQNAAQLTLLPGTNTTYAVNWNGRDRHGALITGDILVSASLNSVPGGRLTKKYVLTR
jgi:hypothetical protein